MGRREYEHAEISCARGINQQPEFAKAGEVVDARNVWAPEGRVIAKPGSQGIVSLGYGSGGSPTNAVLIWEDDPLGTPSYTTVSSPSNLTFTTPAVRDNWYYGVDDNLSNYSGVRIPIITANTAASYFTASYWNGSAWKWLRMVELDNYDSSGDKNVDATTTDVGYHLSGAADAMFWYVPPSDWATTTIDSQTKYFIRFTLHGDALDNNTAIDADSKLLTLSTGAIHAIVPAQFSSYKRYYTIVGTVEFDSANIELDNLTVRADSDTFATRPLRTLGTWAVLPEFDETYIAIDNKVTLHNQASSGSTAIQLAAVESSSLFVGPQAPYSKDYISQRTAWPDCKFITFFQGRLWAANLKDRATDVLWSAPQPYHKVWPTISVEPLMEDDNSPITGIAGLGEQLVVFKQDSIWIMSSTGTNAFGLATYTPIRVVAGVGAVSHHSIRRIRGQLIFLAEDGLYAFDGTPNIRKISEDAGGADRLRDFFESVTSARREFAVAAHWKSRSLYLLGLSVNGSDTNNRVLVWDYKHDAWWIWDNMQVQLWVEDEGASDEETIYWADDSGNVHILDVGGDDHYSAFTSYVVTHRIGYGDNIRKRVRQIEVTGSSLNDSMTVEIWPNDNESQKTSGTLSFRDPAETATILDLRRPRRLNFRISCDHFQVKCSQSTANTNLDIGMIDAAFQPLGRR